MTKITYEDVRVSPNFMLSEMSVSASRPSLVTPIPREHQPAAIKLITEALQPIRDSQGAVRITSGYRNRALNTAVGGSATSQHLVGEAADIVTHNVRTTFDALRNGRIRGNFGQVIYYPESGFIHVATQNASWREPAFFEVRAGRMRRF